MPLLFLFLLHSGRPECSNITGYTVDLTWTARESYGGAEITNYILEYRVQGDTKWKRYTPKGEDTKVVTLTHKVEGLKEDTYYEFHVAAENRAGMGPFSDPSEPAKTPIVGDAPVLEDSLKDVTVIAPETAAFECRLQAGEPEANIQWFKSSKVNIFQISDKILSDIISGVQSHSPISTFYI